MQLFDWLKSGTAKTVAAVARITALLNIIIMPFSLNFLAIELLIRNWLL